jgi:hypothetical protein
MRCQHGMQICMTDARCRSAVQSSSTATCILRKMAKCAVGCHPHLVAFSRKRQLATKPRPHLQGPAAPTPCPASLHRLACCQHPSCCSCLQGHCHARHLHRRRCTRRQVSQAVMRRGWRLAWRCLGMACSSLAWGVAALVPC